MLFTGPMAKAIWDQLKRQTRRPFSDKLVINQDPDRYKFHYYGEADGIQGLGACFEDLRPGDTTPWIQPIPCPYGEPGDLLWVRENVRAEEVEGLDGVRYLADNVFIAQPNTREAADAWVDLYHYGKKQGATVPCIHAPRWVSRLLLEVTAVRVERVQDISEADAVAEGCRGDYWCALNWKYPIALSGDGHIGRENYASLWQEINGPDSWAANPWVWVIEFKEVSRAKYLELTPVAAAMSQNEQLIEPDLAPFVSNLVAPPPAEIDALCAAHPALTAPIMQAYELGLGDLKQVLGTLDKPRQPGRELGGLPGRCINDLPVGLVRTLNVAVAARLLDMWLPFALQHFERDELRLLRQVQPHLLVFLNNLHAALARRNLFKTPAGGSSLAAAKAYVEEMGDVLSLSLDELNAAADPREPLAAMKMYNDLGMVQEQPAEAPVTEEELVDA